MYIHLLERVKGALHENANFFVGCTVACGFPGHVAWSACHRKRRRRFLVQLTSTGPGIPEGREHRRATARSTVAVSLDGAILERQLAGRGRGVLFGATEGIRPALDGRSKGLVSERHRTIARPACIFCVVVAPSRLRERHGGHPGSSQA